MRIHDLMDIHPLLADRVRISIIASLAASESPVSFNDLLDSLNTTKGNLSSHLKKLEQGKLITVRKQFVERKPLTTYKCSQKGRLELEKYLDKMSQLIAIVGGKN